jgi:leucyl-tRNA synthetase
MYLAFIGPYNEPGHYPWNLDGVTAMRKFLDRVYSLSQKIGAGEVSEELARALARAEAKVADDSERFKFNTALSALMILLKELEALEEVPKEAFGTFLKLLAPFAPHLTDHLYRESGFKTSVHVTAWPERNQALLVDETATVIVQVKGKRRGELRLSKDATEEEALAAAHQIESVAALLTDASPKRVVYVPGKILNIVPA